MSRRRGNYSGSDSEDEGRSRHKRRRMSESFDTEDRLESLIMRVGEKSTSSLESNLEGLATVLESDLSNYKQKIIKIMCECIIQMPEKITVYSTLLGLLNAKNYNFGGEFIEFLTRTLKETLKTNEFENAHAIVRFLSDLANCHVVMVGSLITLFDNFMEVTLEDNIPQVRSDWYVYAFVSSLPWCAKELFEKKTDDFNRLVQMAEKYIEKRQRIHVPTLRVWSSDIPHPQEEYLDCLWAQIKNMEANGWTEKHILRPYMAFDSVLCDALQHSLPQLIPPSHHEDAVYPLPKIVYRMFDYTDVPEGPPIPGSHAIERYLVEVQLHQIIKSLHLERKDCAAALLSFPVKTNLPINYMIVEVVFAQLFQLPRPPHIELFYGSLLIELCKLQPSSMPQVLAQAAEMLYERLDTMNTTCIERYATWFSYHLSNFQYRWSWDEWNDCLQVDSMCPKPVFVKEVLVKAMRLAYHQKVKDSIPTVFEPLLPAKPTHIFKYEQEGVGSDPGTMTAHKLIQAIKTKCTPEEAVDVLKDLPQPMDSDDPRVNPLKVEVFVTVLLHLGSKSFSHSFAAIAKFHPVLKALTETQEAQITLLKALYSVWRNHQQMMVVIIDKLLKTQVVECSAVANWLFAPEMSEDFTRFYVWEIMHSTIKKMNKQVMKLQKEVDDARDAYEAHQRKVRDGLEDLSDDENVPSEEKIERLEDKLETAQGEQKNLFLIIFQRFIMILTDHLAKKEAEGQDFTNPWYKWVIERLQQVFLQHHEQVYKYINTLETYMFTSDIDLHILQVFQQFCALRS